MNAFVSHLLPAVPPPFANWLLLVPLAIPAGYSVVYVHVHAFNTGAIRLYKQLGYKVGTGRGQ